MKNFFKSLFIWNMVLEEWFEHTMDCRKDEQSEGYKPPVLGWCWFVLETNEFGTSQSHLLWRDSHSEAACSPASLPCLLQTLTLGQLLPEEAGLRSTEPMFIWRTNWQFVPISSHRASPAWTIPGGNDDETGCHTLGISWEWSILRKRRCLERWKTKYKIHISSFQQSRLVFTRA